MNNKQEILTLLRDEFTQWEAMLAGLGAAQVVQPRADALSLKDELTHLWAWQQISRAHLRAALHDQTPEYPTWPVKIVPGDEGDLTYINDWIYTTYGDLEWEEAHNAWRAGFQDFLALSEALPTASLFEAGKYPWFAQYRLVDVLIGSYEHHQEHREEIQAWLDAGGAT